MSHQEEQEVVAQETAGEELVELETAETTEPESAEQGKTKKEKAKKEKKQKAEKEPVRRFPMHKDGKQTKILVVLTSFLFAAVSTLFYIVDWTLEWGLIKIVSCILVGIWMFFLPPAIRLSYLVNEGKSPGQWFMMGYHGGASGLWMPVLLAPLFGILYFLPRTYRNVVTEAPFEESDLENAEQVGAEVQTEAKPQEPVAVAKAKPQEAPQVVVVSAEERPAPVSTPQEVKATAPTLQVQPEIKIEAVPAQPVQPEIKIEAVPAKPAQPEVKAEAKPASPAEPEVRVVPVIISPRPHDTPADESKKTD